MTLRELLAVVAPSKAAATEPLAEALHDGEGHEASLLVRVFSAIGTWIGAAMIATIFAALEIHRLVPLALVLALALFVGAVWLSRRPARRRSLVLTQLIWALALGGHGLLWGALAELHVDDIWPAAIETVLCIVMVFLVRVPSFAIASAVCAVGFATWLSSLLELPIYPLWAALPAVAVATAAWVAESRLVVRIGRSWSALAYGLPIGVAFSLSSFGIDDESGMRYLPGVSVALLWLLLAHLRKSMALQVIGSIQLVGFLVLFYYQIQTTLLMKSLWVLSTGAVLLLGARLLRPRARDVASKPKARPRMLPALVLVVLTVGLVVGPSMHEQRILASGQTVLLPLAPVDPRSLIQGDYMQLRYELELELGLHDRDDIARHGKLVIELDDEGVGHFVRIDDGTPLQARERLLEYRLREDWGQNLRIGAESFLFEEGTAALYQAARYGELVVSEDGEAILVGLRDASKQPLGHRMHE